jgi:Ca2+-binding EF-hand superfamily protein
MLKTMSLLLAATMFALPAIAQSAKPAAANQKQCADQFKAADINNDGMLSRTEIGNAQQTLPASLANKDRVTRSEFMTVCSKSAS